MSSSSSQTTSLTSPPASQTSKIAPLPSNKRRKVVSHVQEKPPSSTADAGDDTEVEDDPDADEMYLERQRAERNTPPRCIYSLFEAGVAVPVPGVMPEGANNHEPGGDEDSADALSTFIIRPGQKRRFDDISRGSATPKNIFFNDTTNIERIGMGELKFPENVLKPTLPPISASFENKVDEEEYPPTEPSMSFSVGSAGARDVSQGSETSNVMVVDERAEVDDGVMVDGLSRRKKEQERPLPPLPSLFQRDRQVSKQLGMVTMSFVNGAALLDLGGGDGSDTEGDTESDDDMEDDDERRKERSLQRE